MEFAKIRISQKAKADLQILFFALAFLLFILLQMSQGGDMMAATNFETANDAGMGESPDADAHPDVWQVVEPSAAGNNNGRSPTLN
jgi:hypothetical protein